MEIGRDMSKVKKSEFFQADNGNLIIGPAQHNRVTQHFFVPLACSRMIGEGGETCFRRPILFPF